MTRLDQDPGRKNVLPPKTEKLYRELVAYVNEAEVYKGIEEIALHDVNNVFGTFYLLLASLPSGDRLTSPLLTWHSTLMPRLGSDISTYITESGKINPRNLMESEITVNWDQMDELGLSEAKSTIASMQRILKALIVSYYFLKTGSGSWYNGLSNLKVLLQDFSVIATIVNDSREKTSLNGFRAVIIWNLIHNAYKAASMVDPGNWENIQNLVKVMANRNGIIDVVNLSVSSLPEPLVADNLRLVGGFTRGQNYNQGSGLGVAIARFYAQATDSQIT